MKTDISEIAPDIYRLSTFVKAVGPTGFTFNQFLIDADQPLLFHYGQRALFPLVSDAVKRVIPLTRLRWTTCSHVEGDESGALNEWLAAAPNATIDNAYGPTECTVDACFYRWDPERSPAECIHGMAPIGYPGNQVGIRVVDEAFHDVPEGDEGELLISGPQVSAGYWKDPERTAAAFIRLGDDSTLYYRTGDLVRRPYPGEPLQFLGRFDHQIKIGGVRIELGEIEQALREAAVTDQAVAVGWPRTASGASGIIAFVVAEHADAERIREQLRQRLPTVMVPREIHLLDELPLNANGKVDRKMLVETLQAAEA